MNLCILLRLALLWTILEEGWKNRTYRSATRNVLRIEFCLLEKRFHLVPRVVTGVVVSPDDGLDDLGVVRHLGHDLRLLGLHARGLHGRHNLGLFAFGHAAESNSWNKEEIRHYILNLCLNNTTITIMYISIRPATKNHRMCLYNNDKQLLTIWSNHMQLIEVQI